MLVFSFFFFFTSIAKFKLKCGCRESLQKGIFNGEIKFSCIEISKPVLDIENHIHIFFVEFIRRKGKMPKRFTCTTLIPNLYPLYRYLKKTLKIYLDKVTRKSTQVIVFQMQSLKIQTRRPKNR